MNIYYLGPEGSFSHYLVTKEFSGQQYVLYPLPSFGMIFSKVMEEADSIGVVPIENSITSSVHENIDYIFDREVCIIGEGYLGISLHLLGLAGATPDSIKKAASHPKALSQCSQYLRRRKLPVEEFSSTGEAAKTVKENADPACAVIGGEILGELHNLSVIEANIGNNDKNYTRFLYVAQTPIVSDETRCDRLTVTFQIKHEPGALVQVLSALSAKGANLTKIESRPIPGREWEYNFWLDLDAPHDIRAGVSEVIRSTTLEYRILGVYRRGEIYTT